MAAIIPNQDIGNRAFSCRFLDQGREIPASRSLHHGGSRSCFEGPDKGLCFLQQKAFHQALFAVQVVPGHKRKNGPQQQTGKDETHRRDGKRMFSLFSWEHCQ